MILRGIDRAHDVDLGPSHYQPVHGAMRFQLIADQPSEAELLRAKQRAKDRKRPPRPEPTANRCGHPMPKAGTTCARVAGHATGSGHKSRATMDATLLGYRR
jgi:hypothetical protein